MDPEKIPNSAMPFSGGMGGTTPTLPQMAKPAQMVDVSKDLRGSIDRVNSMLNQAGTGTVTQAALMGGLGMVDKLAGIQHNNQMQPLEAAKTNALVAGTEADVLTKTKITDRSLQTMKDRGIGGGGSPTSLTADEVLGLLNKFAKGYK